MMVALSPSIRSLAIVVPVFNEEESLPALFLALEALRARLVSVEIRIVFVDDHSDDLTTNLLRKYCSDTRGADFLRLSRRSGSHVAVLAGLSHCHEDCAAFIAADLQDPPELLPRMVSLIQEGNDVVWAARDNDASQGWTDAAASRLFHKLLQRFSNLSDLPYQATFALLSKRAYQNLVRNCSLRSFLFVEIPRLGYRVASITFRKPERMAGQSKWSLRQKLIAFADAFVTSTYVPLRAMAYTGMAVSGIGFLYATILITFWITGLVKVEGWTSTMVVILVIGGLQILMLGIIGEYLWRAEEGTRRRALYFIEEASEAIDEKKSA
jgi:glycosyltransferase involved in cell wall biosynthesis